MLLISLVLFLSTVSQVTLSSDSPWVLTSSSLPWEPRYMATLANGQLAITPYLQSPSTGINVNCLYNGDSWTSHRARLPNYANYQILAEDANITEYTLDMRRAEFRTLTVADHWRLEHRVFVHRARELEGVIVNVFHGNADTNDNVDVELGLDPGAPSDDITNTGVMEDDVPANSLGIDKLQYRCEHTMETEFDEYQQTGPSPICVGWMTPSPVTLTGNDVNPPVKIFVTLVEASKELLFKQLELLIEMCPTVDDLINLHYDAWDTLWSKGTLEVTGDPELERVVLASQYYLLSSLPATESSNEFCGLSPGSLAYGDEAKDYQGHSFWDTEIWMYPPVLLLHPNIARMLLEYRWARMEAARDYAAMSGWSGTRYYTTWSLYYQRDTGCAQVPLGECCHRC